MSEEKTEKPTEKRLQDARRKGLVVKSRDLTSALVLIVGLAFFWFGGNMLANNLRQTTQKGIETAGSFSGELSRERASELLYQATLDFGAVLMPLLLLLVVAIILFNFIQNGFVFSFDRVKADWKRVNFSENFKQKFFQSGAYLELTKTLLKAIVVIAIVSLSIYVELPNLAKMLGQPAPEITAYFFRTTLQTGLYVGIVFLAFGIGDYFLQRSLFLNQMKMTKQEVKQEMRESEGDPLTKWLRRKLHREMLQQDYVVAVENADVVILSPEKLAVALKYDRETMAAPVIVAKGAGSISTQIREIAKKAGVMVMRDAALADELYQVEVNAEIPEKLYEMLAEVFNWVYSSKEEEED